MVTRPGCARLLRCNSLFSFFFNDPATTEIYTLSLHDALPIYYSVSVMNHVNIASNCAQCHAAGRSFANMAPPTLKLPPANHIPVGTASCESCHAVSNCTTFVIANKSTPMSHDALHGAALHVRH